MSKTLTIFFAQGTETKRVKIGHTSQTPENGIKAFRSQLSEEVTVLKTIVGTSALAKSLREEFELLQVNNLKWFNPHPELLARINSIEDHDGKPPKAESEPKPKHHYESEIHCCYCNTNDELQIMDGGRSGFLTTNNNHRDWGGVAIYGWAGTNKLCWECALDGGFANDIFEVFRDNRQWLHPFWEERDEEFLAQCDVEISNASILYIWEKTRIFTTETLGRFFSKNPSGDLNKAKRFLLEYLDEVVGGNSSDST